MLLYIIYIIISPLVCLALYFISIFNYKIRANHCFFYNQLFRIKKIIKSSAIGKDILLFHAASAGEYEQLKPILRLVNREKYFIIQSFTSPTIYEKVNSNSNLFDIACYHPYDFFWRSWIFFKILNPHKYIITRHDVWPGHIIISKLFNIKTYFINANIHKKSIWYKPYFKSLTKWLFNQFNMIIVPSQLIKNNLLLINVSSSIIEVMKDTRFEQILYRSIHHIPKIKLPKYFLDLDTIIFGSVDYYDEQVIYPAIIKLYPDGSQSLIKKSQACIIVPHEVDKKTISRISVKLTSNQFNVVLSSKMKFTNISAGNIILVDQIGLLAELYKYANIAYIGGGFSKGVHSILEPAIYNCSLLSGPNIEMLDEAKEFAQNHHLTILKDSNMLYNNLSKKTINSINTSALFEHCNSSKQIIKLLTC